MAVSRVIFLDFDGVLNDPQYLMNAKIVKSSDQLDPKKIIILDNICNLTGAKVVLTSSWRQANGATTFLKRCGIPVIGRTPHCKDDNRDQEIFQWMLDKKFTGDFVILDDENHYNKEYQKHLIYTREGDTLGLQYKHIFYARSLFERCANDFASLELIRATLLLIKEELDRVMWNIYQEEYDSPFGNTGNHFSTDVFQVNAYDWGWDLSDSSKPQPPNFIWNDIQITWYKWFGRGLHTNRLISHIDLDIMLQECLESLQKYEKEHDAW